LLLKWKHHVTRHVTGFLQEFCDAAFSRCFLADFSARRSAETFLKRLHCLFIVAAHSPLLLIVSGKFLRGSDWEKGGEDGLLGHVAERNYLCYLEGFSPASYCERSKNNEATLQKGVVEVSAGSSILPKNTYNFFSQLWSLVANLSFLVSSRLCFCVTYHTRTWFPFLTASTITSQTPSVATIFELTVVENRVDLRCPRQRLSIPIQ
jgi:hypothetical protein